jgi:hypothetical protein
MRTNMSAKSPSYIFWYGVVSVREVMAYRRYCLGRDYNIHLGGLCWLGRVGLARFGNVSSIGEVAGRSGGGASGGE